MKTYGQQLSEIQDAITSVSKNQSFKYGNREYYRADLGELRKMEEYLVDKLQKYGDVLPTQYMDNSGAYSVEFHG